MAYREWTFITSSRLLGEAFAGHHLMNDQCLWAARAWIEGEWQTSVLLEIDRGGHWGAITPNMTTPPEHARRLSGPLLPGLVNAHSHAFQRAFAGLSERRSSEADDFWSWRERMYRVALQVTTEQMEAIAAQLYVELLRGGYTQICEFHYLHHDISGQHYPDEAAMCWALASAAQAAGIGLTILPVLYERAGFSLPALSSDQRRFAGTPEFVDRLSRKVRSSGLDLISSAVAIHSLRAVSAESLRELIRLVGDDPAPIHIHVAEQTAEVDECLKATGKRPIEYLCSQVDMDRRWQLVHATHATRREIDSVAESGAGIVICPSTEGNLGDGIVDLPGWFSAGVPMSIGSDSQVVRNWPEELRWLEYTQRMTLHQRSVAARPNRHPATAASLIEEVIAAGAASSGQPLWGLVKGARADALIVDLQAPALLGIPEDYVLDALVFASPEPLLHEVMIAGRVVMRNGQHPRGAEIASRFQKVMKELWG